MRELNGDAGPLRIGVIDRYPAGDPVHPECADAVREAGRLLEALGHRIEADYPAALSDPGIGKQIGLVASSYLGLALDQLAESLSREVTADDVEPATWARAKRGRQATAVDHARALIACSGFRRAVHQWWADGYDLLLTPTTGEPPAPLGALASDPTVPVAGSLSAKYTAFTRAFNITGQPAISLPLCQSSEGLPIGIHLSSRFGDEGTLLALAASLEEALPWAGRRPALHAESISQTTGESR